jgi:hypothetical protein
MLTGTDDNVTLQHRVTDCVRCQREDEKQTALVSTEALRRKQTTSEGVTKIVEIKVHKTALGLKWKLSLSGKCIHLKH